MEINELKKRPTIDENTKLSKAFNQFEKLLLELRKKTLSNEITNFINEGIDKINSSSDSDKSLTKQIKKTQSSILKKLEKELKLVPKNYYRNLWMGLGMAAFGLPIGVALSTSLGNMAFLGIGLPVGLALGLSVGTEMDKKAFKEGRQIDMEIK